MSEEGEKNGEEENGRKDETGANNNDDDDEGKEREKENDIMARRLQQQSKPVPEQQPTKENGGDKNNKQKTPSSGEPRPAGGSSSSAALTEATTDAESQATTTNVDESGDSDAGGQQNEPGKMFIGGLSWQTSAEALRDYFCKFGEVNECMVMRDPTTKRARGFGFITFADPTAVEKVLVTECHELDGKRIDPKVAFPKKQQPKMVVKTKKVFIGGLSSNSTLDDIKAYFSQYGKIEDAMLMFDKATQRHRGFGFITFDDDEVSDKVCEIHFHEINGKMVECKKAQPKEVMLPVQLNKTRAAAARNLYGLAPEQLLAYASYMPRMAPFYGPTVPSAMAHHGHPHGLLTAYPTVSAGMFGNGFPHPPHQPGTVTSANAFGIATSGRSSTNNNGTAGLNARDFATAQIVAQQQAVYEAAMVYANQLSTLAGNSASGDFSGSSTAVQFGGRGGHHQSHHHSPHQQQQAAAFLTSGPQQSHHAHHFASMPPSVLAAPPVHFHHHHHQQQQHMLGQPQLTPGCTPASSGNVVPLNYGKPS
uniref:RRM domain-containing protein n=1 Tax=Globodera rostochiensis TaxID=31243 RepID=A0A914HBK2_GLORO